MSNHGIKQFYAMIGQGKSTLVLSAYIEVENNFSLTSKKCCNYLGKLLVQYWKSENISSNLYLLKQKLKWLNRTKISFQPDLSRHRKCQIEHAKSRTARPRSCHPGSWRLFPKPISGSEPRPGSGWRRGTTWRWTCPRATRMRPNRQRSQ